MSRASRMMMIARDHPALSMVRQCALLGIGRSSVYYRPVPTCAEDLGLMALIDRQYLKTPFYGSWRMTAWLNRQDFRVNRKRVRRRRTGHILTSCVVWPSIGPARCGRPTSPIFRWPGAFFTWWRSWTGSAVNKVVPPPAKRRFADPLAPRQNRGRFFPTQQRQNNLRSFFPSQIRGPSHRNPSSSRKK